MTQLKRILVPTDFGRTSDLAFHYAFDLARGLRASIHVLHIIEPPRYGIPADGYFVGLADLQVQMTHEAERRLSEMQRRYTDRDVRVTTQVGTGTPAQRVVEEAVEHESDVIVMGTHGRSGIAHLLMGSVAESVVRSAPCPVLTVRGTPRVLDMLSSDETHDAHEVAKV